MIEILKNVQTFLIILSFNILSNVSFEVVALALIVNG